MVTANQDTTESPTSWDLLDHINHDPSLMDFHQSILQDLLERKHKNAYQDSYAVADFGLLGQFAARDFADQYSTKHWVELFPEPLRNEVTETLVRAFVNIP